MSDNAFKVGDKVRSLDEGYSIYKRVGKVVSFDGHLYLVRFETTNPIIPYIDLNHFPDELETVA